MSPLPRVEPPGQAVGRSRARTSLSRRVVVLLATVTTNVYLVFGTFVMASLAVLGAVVPWRRSWFSACARVWSQGLLRAAGVRVEVWGREGLDGASPYVYMANHQSMLDIPALFVALPGAPCFLAKKSLFRIPLFGLGMRLGGFIAVDRKDRRQAADAFAQSLERLEEGNSLVVFPEETRSGDGRILPFKRGGFLVAIKSRRPIVPVGIRGTLGVRRKGSWWVRPARVQVAVGPPVDPADYGLRRKHELVTEVRNQVARLAAGQETMAAGSESERSVARQAPYRAEDRRGS